MATLPIKENKMKLTNQQLRRTIRRVLMENQSHYEKLAALLTGNGNPRVELISQAISLGEALGYISVIEEEPSPTGYRVYYELVLSQEFFDVAEPYLAAMKASLLDDCEIYDAERMIRFVATDR